MDIYIKIAIISYISIFSIPVIDVFFFDSKLKKYVITPLVVCLSALIPFTIFAIIRWLWLL